MINYVCQPHSKHLSTRRVFLLDWLEREMVDMLRRKGKKVPFGIHPVASKLRLFAELCVSLTVNSCLLAKSFSLTNSVNTPC